MICNRLRAHTEPRCQYVGHKIRSFNGRRSRYSNFRGLDGVNVGFLCTIRKAWVTFYSRVFFDVLSCDNMSKTKNPKSQQICYPDCMVQLREFGPRAADLKCLFLKNGFIKNYKFQKVNQLFMFNRSVAIFCILQLKILFLKYNLK